MKWKVHTPDGIENIEKRRLKIFLLTLCYVIAMVSPPSSSGSVERRDKRKEVGAGRDASNAVECRAHLIFV